MLDVLDWPTKVKRAADDWARSADPYGAAYDQLFEKFVVAEQAESWEQLHTWGEGLQRWGFRGQREATWTLRTSLEWMIRVRHSHGHYHLDRGTVGRELLLQFQKHAPRFASNLPATDDVASWLALMQHFGLPTRLLDWTESPEIALYFAIRKEPKGVSVAKSADARKRSALWAVDLRWLNQRAAEEGYSVPDNDEERLPYWNSVLDQKRQPLVVRIDPLKGNERMKAQKGFFLWKLFEETPYFDQILMSMILHPNIPSGPVIRKLEIPFHLRPEFLEKLRGMGIGERSLFPPESSDAHGLETLCRSLKRDLEMQVEGARLEAEDQSTNLAAKA